MSKRSRDEGAARRCISEKAASYEQRSDVSVK